MAIEGYKAFRHDMTTDGGIKFEVGKTYHASELVGVDAKNKGFLVCTNLEDSCRYVHDDDMKIARVTGFGTVEEEFDAFYDYFDMYGVSDMTINHLMLREEVIEEVLKGNELRACRFINTGFMLTEKERQEFRNRFKNPIVDNCIRYQEVLRYEKMKLKNR